MRGVLLRRERERRIYSPASAYSKKTAHGRNAHITTLKDEYWNALTQFTNRSDLTRQTFNKGTGSFNFLDPLGVLRVIRGELGAPAAST